MRGNFLWSPIYGFSFQIWTSVRHLRCESCFFLLSKHLYQNPQAFKSRVCKHWTRLSTHSIWPSYFPVHSNHISVYWKMTFKTGANLLGSSGLGVSLLIWFWSLPIVSKGDLASWRCFLGNRDDCFQHVKKRHLCCVIDYHPEILCCFKESKKPSFLSTRLALQLVSCMLLWKTSGGNNYLAIVSSFHQEETSSI